MGGGKGTARSRNTGHQSGRGTSGLPLQQRASSSLLHLRLPCACETSHSTARFQTVVAPLTGAYG
eukprot:7290843-Alexandrium_andersonii.AAC.1